jgi:hypothetical protein
MIGCEHSRLKLSKRPEKRHTRGITGAFCPAQTTSKWVCAELLQVEISGKADELCFSGAAANSLCLMYTNMKMYVASTSTNIPVVL